MRRIKDILEQHAEKGRFKPTTPRYVSNTAVASPRPSSDSADVKLKEDGGLAQNTLLDKKEKPMSNSSAEISFQSVKEVVIPQVKSDIKYLDSVSFLKKHGLIKSKAKEKYASESVERVDEMRKMASGGRDNAGGQYYDIHNSDGTIGFGYKPGKSQPSSSHSNYEMKPEPKHPLHGKIVTAKHSNGQEVTGRLMGTEHQGTVAKIKHSSGMIHSTDAKTVKKAISEMKGEVVVEAKDPKEYGYEGDMAMNQLQTIMRHAKYLMDMMKPDTDLPEWVQSKITLAADYIQTSCDYMTSEMNEASSPAQQAAIAINMKKKGIKPKDMKEETKPPFAGPYKKPVGTVKDKSGAVHTPMSRAKDLAKKAAMRQSGMKKESIQESRRADIIREAMKAAKEKVKKEKQTADEDKFIADPELNSKVIKTASQM